MSHPWLRVMARRLLAWSLAWVLSGALYLLLIDTISLPELLVGAGAATLAATGFELAREQHVLGASIAPRWLARLYRPFFNVPRDILWVSVLALRQLLEHKHSVGEFRCVRFRCGEEKGTTGREALAESFGSFAPNTIVIGVDADRDLILAHQLRKSGGREAVDVLELG
jgi:hypothetical protein